MIITIVAGGQPGFVLGFFLVAGTAAAALAVRPRAVYRVVPVPALAYVAASLVTVPVSGSGASSRTALALGVVQALASGFLAIIVATVIAIAVTVARGRRAGQARRGRGPRPSGGPAGTLISNSPRPAGHSGRAGHGPPSPLSPLRPLIAAAPVRRAGRLLARDCHGREGHIAGPAPGIPGKSSPTARIIGASPVPAGHDPCDQHLMPSVHGRGRVPPGRPGRRAAVSPCAGSGSRSAGRTVP